jgi:hypothetical protein
VSVFVENQQDQSHRFENIFFLFCLKLLGGFPFGLESFKRSWEGWWSLGEVVHMKNGEKRVQKLGFFAWNHFNAF